MIVGPNRPGEPFKEGELQPEGFNTYVSFQKDTFRKDTEIAEAVSYLYLATIYSWEGEPFKEGEGDAPAPGSA